jgi:hypothetical protein
MDVSAGSFPAESVAQPQMTRTARTMSINVFNADLFIGTHLRFLFIFEVNSLSLVMIYFKKNPGILAFRKQQNELP